MCVYCLFPPKGQDRAWVGTKTRRASPTEVSPYELGRERLYPTYLVFETYRFFLKTMV